jgi:hypothetical protein
LGGAVFWPLNTDPTFDLIGISDHRLVYLDLQIRPIPAEAVRNLSAAWQNGSVVLTWDAAAGHTYRVEHSAGLDGPWVETPAIPVTVDAGLHATAIHAAAAGPRHFYRVVIGFQ